MPLRQNYFKKWFSTSFINSTFLFNILARQLRMKNLMKMPFDGLNYQNALRVKFHKRTPIFILNPRSHHPTLFLYLSFP